MNGVEQGLGHVRACASLGFENNTFRVTSGVWRDVYTSSVGTDVVRGSSEPHPRVCAKMP